MNAAGTPIEIHNHIPKQPWLSSWTLRVLLIISVIANISLFGLYQQYYPKASEGERFVQGDKYAKSKILRVKVSGMITSDSVKAARGDLKTAESDSDIVAILLTVDTPGGTMTGSDELYHAITEYKSKTTKPIIVSMQGLATSGGYYISTPADRIFADRTCITGSIGVIANLFSAEKLLSNWGITPEVFKSGKFKDNGSPMRTMTPDDRKEWQDLIESMYGQFLAVILKHRDKQIGGEDKLKAIADGRVFLADEALKLGLIDEVGYEQDALAFAKKMTGVGDNVRVIEYTRPLDSVWDLLSSQAPVPAGLDLQSKLKTNLSLEVGRPLLLPSAFLIPSLGSN